MGDAPEHAKNSSLSVGLVCKMKVKAHHLHVHAHERALDRAMAMGQGCMHTAKDHTDAQNDDAPGQTNFEAVMNMLNNCLGSGVLCVPLLVKNVGLVCGLTLLIISATLNRFGLMTILECMDICKVDASYNGVGRVAFGDKGRLAVCFIFIAMTFGCMVSYVDATAATVGGLLELFGFINFKDFVAQHTLLPMQLACTFLLVPPTFIRSLKNIAPISVASFICALIVVGVVVTQDFAGLAKDGVAWDQLKFFPSSAGDLLAAIPTAVAVFAIQAGGSITMSALKDPSPANKSKVSLYSYIIVLLVNIAIGLPSYMQYRENTPGNIIEALPESSPLTIIGKTACLGLVVPCYMMMMIPCRVAAIELIWKKNESKMEAEKWQFVAVTCGLNVAAIFVATLVSDLSLVIGLVGAIAANSVAFILPCSFYLKSRIKPVNEGYTATPFGSLSTVPYLCLIAFSFFSMFTGIYFLLNPSAPVTMVGPHIVVHHHKWHAHPKMD